MLGSKACAYRKVLTSTTPSHTPLYVGWEAQFSILRGWQMANVVLSLHTLAQELRKWWHEESNF